MWLSGSTDEEVIHAATPSFRLSRSTPKIQGHGSAKQLPAIAEADEVAAAEARAQAARARAVRLRELADAASSDPVDWPDADDASDTEAERDDKVTLSEVEAKTLPAPLAAPKPQGTGLRRRSCRHLHLTVGWRIHRVASPHRRTAT